MPEVDTATLASLNAMDADGLRAFAKENEIKVTPLPNVRAETLRSQIVDELTKRAEKAAENVRQIHPGTDPAPAAAATVGSVSPSSEAAPSATDPATEAAEAAATQAAEAHAPVADPGADDKAEAAEAVPAPDEAEFVPYTGDTVHMRHPNPMGDSPEYADVHPDEVENYAATGWLIDEEEDADD